MVGVSNCQAAGRVGGPPRTPTCCSWPLRGKPDPVPSAVRSHRPAQRAAHDHAATADSHGAIGPEASRPPLQQPGRRLFAGRLGQVAVQHHVLVMPRERSPAVAACLAMYRQLGLAWSRGLQGDCPSRPDLRGSHDEAGAGARMRCGSCQPLALADVRWQGRNRPLGVALAVRRAVFAAQDGRPRQDPDLRTRLRRPHPRAAWPAWMPSHGGLWGVPGAQIANVDGSGIGPS
jgi:hypothetical protein